MRIEIQDTEKCESFISIFKHLKNFTDKVCIFIDEEKMYLQGMDDSHVCVYELFLQGSWFDVWNPEFNNTLEHRFGIYLPIFNKMLNIWTNLHTIKLESQEGDNLDIHITSKIEKGAFNNIFALPLMDIEVDCLTIPETEYEVDIIMKSSQFKSTLDSLSQFSETLDISCDDKKLLLKSNSTEGSMKVEIDMENIELLAVVEGETVESSFAIKYITHMCQFHKLSNNVEIHMSPELPIQLIYNIGNDEKNKMRFYLAPKISDD
jgi:proliferating cell nuclear antigen PCNA